MKSFPLIVSSPSGAGKTTVVNAAVKKDKALRRVVTATTRLPRKGEKDGRDYLFWTEKKFLSEIKKGRMAEWAKVHTGYYGIPKSVIEADLKKGLTPVLVIDVQGAATVKKAYPQALSVFILPPSMEELKKRIFKRNDGTKDIELRLKTAKKEMKEALKYDYILVNDNLSVTVNELLCVLKAEKNKSIFHKEFLKRLGA